VDVPSSGSRWDVPVAEVSGLDPVRAADARYLDGKRAQRNYW
jgi:TPP-dependent trihydroxycyclohexane-1,2-dione (THcHDO) dehydratase